MEVKTMPQGHSDCRWWQILFRHRFVKCFHPSLLIIFGSTLPFLLTGCNGWPWREGAVPDSVAMCRELSQQAIVSMEADRWQEAEGLLDRAVTACPIDPDARRYYAETLLQRGASADALSQL
ncbi:MAG: hypothetical protein P8M53_13790, partial [Pirellulales bacterium]|nr:hypothetical protein [Pirellulales bacterium]